MILARKQNIETLSDYIPEIFSRINKLPIAVRSRVQEIRLREGRFVTLELSAPSDRICLDIKTSAADLEEILRVLCRYSVHTYTKQIAEAYITIDGGHRVGFCGTAVTGGDGSIQNIREITSMNFRIAGEYPGCSDLLFDHIIQRIDDLKGLLIIGRPLSAKTTVLRDLIRNIGNFYKVAVVDERGELAAKCGGKLHFDLGANTDVLDNFSKSEGFIRALRALSPEFIATDEIGFDYAKMRYCVNSGVRLLLTAHCSGVEDLNCSGLHSVIETKGISHLALLGTGAEIGKIKGFWEVKVNNGNVEYNLCRFNSIDRSRLGAV
ncbi:MAG: hypothetical protein LBR74_06290 [Eubacterium sp.]|jgi:stage III sporulation protein AA|nr:hypothetical protein [Eubacterium sp.]